MVGFQEYTVNSKVIIEAPRPWPMTMFGLHGGTVGIRSLIVTLHWLGTGPPPASWRHHNTHTRENQGPNCRQKAFKWSVSKNGHILGMVSFHKNVNSPFPTIDKEDGMRSGLPSVSPASSVSDMSSSSEQMLRMLTSISVTETRTLSSSYIIIPNISHLISVDINKRKP